LLKVTIFALQVVNSEDLTAIMGERPFRSAELRNIDKFRDGFAKKIEDAASAVKVAASAAKDAASAAAQEAVKLGQQIGKSEGPNLEGKIVAT
jgi:AFG3 family protein